MSQDFTEAERRAYVPPNCPDCGSTRVVADWQDVSGFGPPLYSLVGLSCTECGNPKF